MAESPDSSKACSSSSCGSSSPRIACLGKQCTCSIRLADTQHHEAKGGGAAARYERFKLNGLLIELLRLLKALSRFRLLSGFHLAQAYLGEDLTQDAVELGRSTRRALAGAPLSVGPSQGPAAA